MRPSLEYLAGEYRRDMKTYIACLESVCERLELIPETSESNQTAESRQELLALPSNTVFIVHGRDNEAKETVARFIEKLGLQAVILHELANRGRTVIEKFEDHADVGFAVVLLTPDDVGGSDPEALNPRARQNVIFELGFFFAKLKRHKVCALHKHDVEIPTDVSGILWVDMDSAGAWKVALAREMKAAGVQFDERKLL